MYYLIKDSKDIYFILQNGIKKGEYVCSIDNLFNEFEKLSKQFVPCIFEVDSSNVEKFSNFCLSKEIYANDLNLIKPNDIGIKHSASNIAYHLYKANDKHINDKIIKIAENLSDKNKDLADYLMLSSKLSFGKSNDLNKFAKELKSSNSYDRILKLSSSIELGNPDSAGKSLADIVLFLMTRIPQDKRSKAVSSMIAKIRDINPATVAGQNMGDYSSMGQSLTFIKNVLAGHNESYVRRVLDAIIRNLS